MNSDWKKLVRHPLSAEYRDINGADWTRFLNKFKKVKFLTSHPIVLHENMVLDGWQRLRACIALDIVPEFTTLGEGISPRDFVEAMNDERRHESAAEREERRNRIAKAREEGKSIRTIAEEEGVSKSTVARDLDKTSTVPPGTVAGKDGRQYTTAKPQTTQPDIYEDDEEIPFANPPFSQPSSNGQVATKKKAHAPAAQNAAPIDDDDEMVDQAGYAVPARLRAIFASRELFRAAAGSMSRSATKFKEVEQSEAYKLVRKVYTDKMLYSSLLFTGTIKMQEMEPCVVCRGCNGTGCVSCDKKGYFAKFEVVPEELGKDSENAQQH